MPSINVPDSHHKKYGIWLIDTDGLEAYWKKQAERFQCKPISEIDRAYIAGLLDGEGCFTAFTTHKKSKASNGLYYGCRQTIYYIQILVVEEEPIRWLKEVTGSGYVFQRKRQSQGWQDLWGWRVCNLPACEIVERIIPYLKIKRRHAEIFLMLRDRVIKMKSYRKGHKGWIAMPDEEYIERQKLIDEIHRLNKRTGKFLRKEYSA